MLRGLVVAAVAVEVAGCACSHLRVTDAAAMTDAGAPTLDAGTPRHPVVPCTVVVAPDRLPTIRGRILAAHHDGDRLYVVSAGEDHAWGSYIETVLHELPASGAFTTSPPIQHLIGEWVAYGAVWAGDGFLVRRHEPAVLVHVSLDGTVRERGATECQLLRGERRVWCLVERDDGAWLRALDDGAERFVPRTAEGELPWVAHVAHDGTVVVGPHHCTATVLDATGAPRGRIVDAYCRGAELRVTTGGFAQVPTDLPDDGVRAAPFAYFDRDGRRTALASPLVDVDWRPGAPSSAAADVVVAAWVDAPEGAWSRSWTHVAAISPTGVVGPITVVEAAVHVVARRGGDLLLAELDAGLCDDCSSLTFPWLAQCR